MIDGRAPLTPRPQGAFDWRGIALSYAFLAAFWALSTQVPGLTATGLALAACLLCLPMTAALWHQATVGRLIALHQFEPGRGLHRWGSRRALGLLARALASLAVTAAVLLQSVFFGALEWALLLLSPWLLMLVRAAIQAKVAPQFQAPVYARRWSFWAGQWLAIAILLAVWVLARHFLSEAPTQTYAERIHALQAGWVASPSALVQWSLDAAAWGQASLEVLGHWPDEAGWRLLLAVVIAPISVFSHAVLTMAGLSLPHAELRRALGPHLSAHDAPPPISAARAGAWAAGAVIGALLVVYGVGAADSRLDRQASPFAIRALPECERIGGVAYQVNTVKGLEALLAQGKDELADARRSACAKLDEVEALAAKGADAYLDWYFSLGGEWSRVATMLTGDVDTLLRIKLAQLIGSDAQTSRLFADLQAEHAQQSTHLIALQGRAQQLLQQNRLVLNERDCRVVNAVAENPLLQQLQSHQATLAVGAGAGLAGGAFAAAIAAKAMGKASAKLAAKVLAKAATKKAAGGAGAAAAGAAIGTAVAPGVGTAVGAAIGAGVGVAIGAGIDMAVLAAQEKLTRTDMKADLLSAVAESLQPYRNAFECK